MKWYIGIKSTRAGLWWRLHTWKLQNLPFVRLLVAVLSKVLKELWYTLFFLSPGKHATKDIPALLEEASLKYPGVEWSLGKTMGLHPVMSALIESSVSDAIAELEQFQQR
mmetsp:Transcript_16199/g.25995  ORF Transcript_16199/g.25995 Transcript_16199/m.25995 type:complete len:110 (+) Transcript_16199:63-392(+)